ncbi:MAG: flagellar export protein FliJ [Anaeromicrobium sp.]|uniref:flagellar export protein FliJ n=1 Tax=Anaeromicrobium sp. TaxID=1929132 RepID=UPI0025F55AE3|nr:flagellar export protein FliJ [Anaeromicrobium sp.]MCT4595581.1 flagellar export protein FliJ [Anaeromicrobium sp.]
MSGFKFKYENIIQIKERMEESAKGRLAGAQRELDIEKNKLNSLVDEKNNCIGVINNRVKEGTNVTFLQQYNSYMNSLSTNIEKKEKDIQVCKSRVNEKREELVRAVKEKKIMEKFKEKEREKFIEWEKKQEILLVDELVTYKNFKSN